MGNLVTSQFRKPFTLHFGNSTVSQTPRGTEMVAWLSQEGVPKANWDARLDSIIQQLLVRDKRQADDGWWKGDG